MRFLKRRLFASKGRLIASVAGAALTATAFGTADPFLLQQFVGEATAGAATGTITEGLIVFGGTLAMNRALWSANTFVQKHLLRRLADALRADLLPRTLEKLFRPGSRGWHELDKSGVSGSQILDDLTKIEAGAEDVGETVAGIAQLTGSIIGLFLLNPIAGAGYFFTTMSLGFAVSRAARKLDDLDRQESEGKTAALELVADRIANLQAVITSPDESERSVAIIGEADERYTKVRRRISKWRAATDDFGWFAINVVAFASTMAVGVATSSTVAEGWATVAMGSYTLVFGARVAKSTMHLSEGRGAFTRTLHTLVRPDVVPEAPDAREISREHGIPLEVERDTVVRHLGTEVPTLDLGEKGLRVTQGSHVVLIGPNGAGKSTLFDAILRGIEVDSGGIKVFGTDVRNATYRSLYEHVAIVPQKGGLCVGTVESNIRFGNADATTTQIHQIFDDVGLGSGLNGLSLQTNVSGRINGNSRGLSGGQERLILLARAVLRDPGLLILDELPELDVFVRRNVDKVLEKLRKRGTAILEVKHDLKDLRATDIVLLLDGRIVDQAYNATPGPVKPHQGPIAEVLRAVEAKPGTSNYITSHAELRALVQKEAARRQAERFIDRLGWEVLGASRYVSGYSNQQSTRRGRGELILAYPPWRQAGLHALGIDEADVERLHTPIADFLGGALFAAETAGCATSEDVTIFLRSYSPLASAGERLLKHNPGAVLGDNDSLAE